MRKLYETQQQEQQAGKYLYSAVGIMRRAQPCRVCPTCGFRVAG